MESKTVGREDTCILTIVLQRGNDHNYKAKLETTGGSNSSSFLSPPISLVWNIK